MQKDKIIRAGVIGWPVSHSLSPRLHGFWLRKYNIAGSYEAIAIDPESFSTMLSQLEEKGFKCDVLDCLVERFKLFQFQQY